MDRLAKTDLKTLTDVTSRAVRALNEVPWRGAELVKNLTVYEVATLLLLSDLTNTEAE